MLFRSCDSEPAASLHHHSVHSLSKDLPSQIGTQLPEVVGNGLVLRLFALLTWLPVWLVKVTALQYR